MSPVSPTLTEAELRLMKVLWVRGLSARVGAGDGWHAGSGLAGDAGRGGSSPGRFA